MITIDFSIDPPSAEIGAHVQDWFDGGFETLERAKAAATASEADQILRAAYRGADVDGASVRWDICE